LVMFLLGEKPRFIFTVDGEIVAVVEFPHVRCPASVDISSDKGSFAAKDLPRSSCL
jgi:hypothetical protein